jgi:phosphatidylserine/phosphatidylglycerophosphate/cardiolipin synthase-like enzyme
MRLTINPFPAVLTAVLAMLISVGVFSAGFDPAVYLTANWPAPEPAAIPMVEQALLDRLNAATTSIDAALYDFDRPSLRDALVAAAARGVAVRMVTDDEERTPSSASQPFYAAIAAAGIPVVDDADATRLMHDKYAVIDGRTVWTGSTNWSDNDLTHNHNNALVFDSPEVAAVYAHDFDQMFGGAFGEAKTASPTTALTYAGNPLEVYFSPQDNALDQVVAEVDAAQSSIDFAIFFFTDDRLRDALLAAKARGVVVRGLFDELGAANASSDDEALCAGGIAVKIEQTTGKLHHKLMVLDAGGANPRVVSGSLNWTAAGDARNSENIVILHGAETARAYRDAFAQWWEDSPPLSGCGMEPKGNQVFLPLALKEPEPAPTPEPTAAPATPAPTLTPAPTPTTPPSGPCACTGNLYNCSDFSSQRGAQACYDWCVSQGAGDVHQLDSDRDGVACESLPRGWRVYGTADKFSE